LVILRLIFGGWVDGWVGDENKTCINGLRSAVQKTSDKISYMAVFETGHVKINLDVFSMRLLCIQVRVQPSVRTKLFTTNCTRPE
jgi:hypothetical protein